MKSEDEDGSLDALDAWSFLDEIWMASKFYMSDVNDYTAYSCALAKPYSIEVAKAFEQAAAKM
tara:strand:+ start:370 stop:558 length:189 start_codon:yes stop_codon:yes gene_type:complete